MVRIFIVKLYIALIGVFLGLVCFAVQANADESINYDIFLIKNIVIEKQASTSLAYAKQRAITEARRSAYEKFLERLSSYGYEFDPSLYYVSDKDIIYLVSEIVLKNEQILTTSYSAEIDIRFSRDKIERLLRIEIAEIGVDKQAIGSQRVLLVPIYLHNSEYVSMYDKDNIWLRTWKSFTKDALYIDLLDAKDISQMEVVAEEVLSSNVADEDKETSQFSLYNKAQQGTDIDLYKTKSKSQELILKEFYDLNGQLVQYLKEKYPNRLILFIVADQAYYKSDRIVYLPEGVQITNQLLKEGELLRAVGIKFSLAKISGKNIGLYSFSYVQEKVKGLSVSEMDALINRKLFSSAEEINLFLNYMLNQSENILFEKSLNDQETTVNIRFLNDMDKYDLFKKTMIKLSADNKMKINLINSNFIEIKIRSNHDITYLIKELRGGGFDVRMHKNKLVVK